VARSWTVHHGERLTSGRLPSPGAVDEPTSRRRICAIRKLVRPNSHALADRQSAANRTIRSGKRGRRKRIGDASKARMPWNAWRAGQAGTPADLAHASLRGWTSPRPNIEGADCRKAELRGTKTLSGETLNDAKLADAKFSKKSSSMPPTSPPPGANLIKGAKFLN